jgi:hypothetical protein
MMAQYNGGLVLVQELVDLGGPNLKPAGAAKGAAEGCGGAQPHCLDT